LPENLPLPPAPGFRNIPPYVESAQTISVPLIEPKWQQAWDAWQNSARGILARPSRLTTIRPSPWPGRKTPSAAELPPKYYILDMFPTRPGAACTWGIRRATRHGHSRAIAGEGFNVLHPMGWDAFGLPAEQYAVKTGQHPAQDDRGQHTTFKRQIQIPRFSYDWTREVDTTDPKYFQVVTVDFLKLYNSYSTRSGRKLLPSRCSKMLSQTIPNAGRMEKQLVP